MNLNAVLTMNFGGPGSGCRGPNCGRPDSGVWPEPSTPKVASADKISSWLEQKGLKLSPKGTELVVNALQNLGVSEAVMKLPLAGIKLGPLAQVGGFGQSGVYNVDDNVLRLDPQTADLGTVPHELTHWALFIQAPEISAKADFPVNTPMPNFPGRPGLKQDLDAAVAEYHAAGDKAAKEVGEKKFDWYKQINEYMNMSDEQAEAAGAPSGYALSHPAEWISEVAAETVAHGKSGLQPATEKLVKNLWGGKYLGGQK